MQLALLVPRRLVIALIGAVELGIDLAWRHFRVTLVDNTHHVFALGVECSDLFDVRQVEINLDAADPCLG